MDRIDQARTFVTTPPHDRGCQGGHAQPNTRGHAGTDEADAVAPPPVRPWPGGDDTRATKTPPLAEVRRTEARGPSATMRALKRAMAAEPLEDVVMERVIDGLLADMRAAPCHGARRAGGAS